MAESAAGRNLPHHVSGCHNCKGPQRGPCHNKSFYLAVGITLEGLKDVLGIWLVQIEGAKFCMKVMTEMKNRGV